MLKYTIIQKPILLQQTFEQQEEIIICSDGALKEKKSGGAFVIATKTEEILVTNKNPDTGHNYFQSSYRSEAQACYSAFLFIFFYCKYHNIQAPSIMYYCDNKGLITRLNNPHKQIATMKECELIQLIQNISKPGQVYKHVYAHQDLKLKALSTPEYINTIADLIASKNRVITRQVHSPKLIAIYQGGKYIPHDITRFLRKTAFLHQAKMFVRNKYEWTNQTYENIHWEAYTTSIYTPSYKQRQQRLKYVHGRLPIGNLNFEATITCPHCNTSELDIQGTTQDHFLCCPGSTSYQKTRLAKITKRLTKNHTPPTIRSLIIHLIIHHYNNTPIPPQHPCISEFITKQKEIGIHHFIRGKISKDIIPLLEYHYKLKSPNKFYTPRKWLENTIEIMQDEHVNAWIEYNQLKHKTSINPHKFRNQINELTTQSKNYDFDPVTKNWFHITDEQLSTMNQHQIHAWKNKAKKLIQTGKKHRNTQVSILKFFKNQSTL